MDKLHVPCIPVQPSLQQLEPSFPRAHEVGTGSGREICLMDRFFVKSGSMPLLSPTMSWVRRGVGGSID